MKLAQVVLACSLLCGGVLWAQDGNDQAVLAKGDGIEISRQALEQAAAKKLADLQLEQERFEAGMKRKRHEALEKTLKDLVKEQLLDKEAGSRNITRDELVKQITSSVAEPTAQDIENFYQQNRSRIRGTRAQVDPQIKNFLAKQNSTKAMDQFVEGLTKKYNVTYQLEPFRVDVEEANAPSRGPADAPVTIVEFSDFQCPYCSRESATVKKVLDTYGDKVRLVFRQFPLTSIHNNAEKAAEASMCAGDQGKFWEMHDAMFAQQAKLTPDDLKELAGTLGLDKDSFSSCLDSGKFAAAIQQDIQAGTEVGVSGTPALFVNGRPLTGAVPFESIAKVIDEELAKE